MRNLTLLVVVSVFLGCSNSTPRYNPPISESGQISILTFNVAGLPNFLTDQDYPKERMYGIASMSNAYDVVAYQEDFYYSVELERHSHLSSVERGVKWHKWSVLWPWLRKSGLTLQTKWENVGSRFRPYSACYGYFKHSSDCWIPKGVLCIRNILPEGIVLDVCTTHMDAGRSKEDVDARSIQIAEYQEFLPKPETGRPWLLVELGDYNMRPYEPLMEKLVKGKDIVISVTGSRNEVDYIMVTSNNMLEVTVVRAGRADKFTGWSDHEAVEAVLTLSKLY